MKIEQLYTGCLAEAAYYIESNGEAAIIDPIREPHPYIEMSKERGTTIKYIFETHFHADFVSGHLDLARQTGAAIVFGPNAETGYESISAIDGQEFKVGDLTIRVLHTPGHTMESSTFLLLDENGKEHCIFSGDTLFIGDVGRPDLAVKTELTQEDLAGHLYDSLRNKIMTLPDDVIVYPAHGAGSACGKNMSEERFDTLGNQKKVNYALSADLSKEDFIKELTTGILPAPAYFPKAVALNKDGYDTFESTLAVAQNGMSVGALEQAVQKGALVLDVRNKVAFAEGHIPGSIFIGIDGSFAVWVGTVIEDIHQPIIVVADAGREEEVVTRLARVGYNSCLGYLEGGLASWKAAGKPVSQIAQINADELLRSLGATKNAVVLDVRKPGEYSAEHVDGAETFPLDFINANVNELSKDRHYMVHCKSGYRSVVAASILMRAGFTHITDIRGGIEAILETDVPVTDFSCSSSQ